MTVPLHRLDHLRCAHCLRPTVWARFAPRSGDGFLRCPLPACERHSFYVVVPPGEACPLLGWRPLPSRSYLTLPVTVEQRRRLERQPPDRVLAVLGYRLALADAA